MGYFHHAERLGGLDARSRVEGLQEPELLPDARRLPDLPLWVLVAAIRAELKIAVRRERGVLVWVTSLVRPRKGFGFDSRDTFADWFSRSRRSAQRSRRCAWQGSFACPATWSDLSDRFALPASSSSRHRTQEHRVEAV
jgi:hypothetical protein